MAETALAPPSGPRPPPDPVAVRDRFLAFAFATADLLLETDLSGVITFAVGAFRIRYGTEPASLLGRPAAVLISPLDQAAFAIALASVALRGRITPLLLHLSDAQRTQACLAAMLVPGPPPRLCLTLGPAPAAAPDAAIAGPAPGVDRGGLARAAASLLGGAGELGLIELHGWEAAREAMTPADLQALRSGIAAILASAGPGVPAGELAAGRFGVLAGSGAELATVLEQLQRLIRASPAARHARLDSTGIRLLTGGLTPSQAARALRFVLTRFAESGTAAAVASGAQEGLDGVIARAGLRARAVQEAIAARRFRLLFQPVVDLATRAVQHYEALLRPIATPGSPVQSAQEFVTFVEAVGLSESLDAAVLEQSCRLLGKGTGAKVAVNVSGLSLQSRSFCERAMEQVAATATAGRLLIELTETAEIEDIPSAATSMHRFREIGVRLCLDDFGSGAAAFRYLRDLPFDIVKIDGCYVVAASRSPRDRGFVVSMIDLARAAGAGTVAEMVETEAQAKLMAELGAQFGQGWLFGRPGALPGAMQ